MKYNYVLFKSSLSLYHKSVLVSLLLTIIVLMQRLRYNRLNARARATNSL